MDDTQSDSLIEYIYQIHLVINLWLMPIIVSEVLDKKQFTLLRFSKLRDLPNEYLYKKRVKK